MISERKLRANRANSKRSTGPKTAAGRAAAAGNARRRGLRIPVLSDPDLSAEVEAMAKKIADGTPELLAFARPIAEAQVDILRIRRARVDMLSRELASERWQLLAGGPRNPRNKRALLVRSLRLLERGELPSELEEQLRLLLKGPEIVRNLPRFGPELSVFDRYEARAASRRKFAVREFDEARARLVPPRKATAPERS